MTATTGCLNGNKMWITNGSVADVAVVWARETARRRIRGFVVPTDTPGFSAPEIKKKMSLRASITSELVLDDVRLPASAMLPEAAGLSGPAVVPQRGPLRHRVRCARGGPRLPGDGHRLRPGPRHLRQAAGGLPADPGQARRHDPRARQGHAARAPPRLAQGRRDVAARAGQPRQAQQRARGHRRSPASAAPSWARPASRWSTRSCATPTTSSPCSPTRAPPRCTSS